MEYPVETKLNMELLPHKLLAAMLATLIVDYGYTTREVFELMNHSQGQLWSALTDLENKKE